MSITLTRQSPLSRNSQNRGSKPVSPGPGYYKHYGMAHFGETASPYLTAYLYNRRFLDKDYGIRKEEDGTFMLGNSPVSVDAQSNVIVHDKLYRGTTGLW